MKRKKALNAILHFKKLITSFNPMQEIKNISIKAVLKKFIKSCHLNWSFSK